MALWYYMQFINFDMKLGKNEKEGLFTPVPRTNFFISFFLCDIYTKLNKEFLVLHKELCTLCFCEGIPSILI